MSKSDMYDNLEQAEGNDLIEERNNLLQTISVALKASGQPSSIVDDFEEIVIELTHREEE